MDRINHLLAVMVLLYAAPSWAQVIRDGNEWLQPRDYSNIAWDVIDAQCPLSKSRVCSSTPVPGIEGYTWANKAQILALFASYGVPAPNAAETGSAWAAALFSDIHPQIGTPTYSLLSIFYSDIAPNPDAALYVRIAASIDSPDTATQFQASKINSVNIVGHLFYRQSRTVAQQVPTIPLYGLLASIVGILVLATRRISRSSVSEG